jgi:ribosome biogenesis GTPase / thiamine phosphate phosphatase
VAANIDTLFLVTGLDDDFNVRRIERALSLGWQSGAAPVILLNKVDVTAEAAARRAEVEAVASGAPIHVVSARHGHGIGELSPYLLPGRTITLIGSSGAGKSTLVNRLLGEDIQRTQEVRSSDSRGRHTTTRRELFLLPGGTWIVDTPGMRELQLWAESDSVDQTFGDVLELAATCRFTNCQHKQEPGCAVHAAVRSGALPERRLESYLKLQDELAALHDRLTVQGRGERKRHDKTIANSLKKLYKSKG